MSAAATAEAARQRAHAERTARDAALAAFTAHAGPDGHISGEDLRAVLQELDFQRRTIALGRGPVKQQLEVAALDSDYVLALNALGLGNAELRSGARVRWEDFSPWYVAQVCGDAGHRRNKLLIKAVPGKARASSYALPDALHTFGAPSLPNEVTLKQLLAHEFSADTASAPTGGAPGGASAAAVTATVVTAAGERTYGAPSSRSDSIATLIKGGFSTEPHTLARQDRLVAPVTGEERHYPHAAEALAASAARRGALPPPRATLTSALRASSTRTQVAAIAAAATVAAGRPLIIAATSAAAVGGGGLSATDAGWKMAAFRQVAPRVPTDGHPLHPRK